MPANNNLLIEIINRCDITSVVGRYVHLIDRGDLLVGICPFHRSTSPTFIAVRRLGLCYCTECGRSWSTVDFLMDIEHISYTEAIERLTDICAIDREDLDKKHSEDLEISADERGEMFKANEFAVDFFHKSLLEDPRSREVGLAYFRERGVNDEMITRFKLGYSPLNKNAFSEAAIKADVTREALLTTGLAVETNNGELIDRYRGRVIYPVFTVSGRPVAFGARTLRTDKDVAKYVNSPESVIYTKSNEIYGLFQAREAIVSANRCILVEGYMDVISMHQAGICNVIASSGTSLTEGHVALIKRFTDRITVIYDADPAGVKASLRSIDMLLSADFKMDLVSLPDGEDPDSFARSHSRTEILAYMEANAIDFVQFKLRLASSRMANDPVERSRVIADIINSISLIPDKILIRQFVKETATLVKMAEQTLQQQVSKRILERRSHRGTSPRHRISSLPDLDSDYADAMAGGASEAHAADLRSYEAELLGLVVRNALLYFCDLCDADGNTIEELNVAQYVSEELVNDQFNFINADYRRIFKRVIDLSRQFSAEDSLGIYRSRADKSRQAFYENGMADLRTRDMDMQSLQAAEATLSSKADALWQEVYTEGTADHIARLLMLDPDTELRHAVTEFVRPHERLSKIHSRGTAGVENERDRIRDMVSRALATLKYAIIQSRITDMRGRISQASAAGEIDTVLELMRERKTLDNVKAMIAPLIGDVVITSRR